MRSQTVKGSVSNEHQHLHLITCHLGILLAMNVQVVEVNQIISGQSDHGGIHLFKACRQPFPDSPQLCCSHQRLQFAVDEARTQQNLGKTIENCLDNMVSTCEMCQYTNTYEYVVGTYSVHIQ
jgi:hypothetical protein